ncbi:hypothetical protein OB13_10870 [Pontibacter sp. HJ8]
MKAKVFLLVLLSLACCYSATGQTIPYRFKTTPLPDTKEEQEDFISRQGKAALFSKQYRTYFKNRAISPFYNDLRADTKALEASLRQDITTIYSQKKSDKQKEFKAAKSPAEAIRLKGELDALIIEEEEQLSKLITLEHLAKEYDYRSRTARRFNLFHVWYAPDAQTHYNASASDKNSKFLNNTLIAYSPQGSTVSIFNEIYADYFGPVRLGFGALVADGGEEEEDSTPPNSQEELTPSEKDAVQRLLGGGGNAVLNASYPFFDLRNRAANFNMKLAFVPKSAVDIPEIGTESGDFSFHWNAGVEGSIFYNGLLNNLTLFTNFRFAVVDGNKNFYQYLGKEKRDAFWFNQISGGLAINSTFRLSYNYYFGSKFSNETLPYNVSLAIVPNQ